MNSYHYKVFFATVAVAMAVSCGGEKGAEETQTVRVISVKAKIATLQDVQVTSTYTGSLEGSRQAVIRAKIAEAVEKVNVREGQSVEAGAVLVELDKTGPTSLYQQSRSPFLNAEKNFKKMEYLYGEGAVSELEFDGARTEYEVSRAAFDAAKHLVSIQSPIAGQVTSLGVSEGDFVQIGQELATVATTSELRVKFGVNSSDIAYFKEGTEIFISSDIVPQQAHGKVSAVAGSANPTTRTFEVEAVVNNSENNYRPGMFVRINTIKQNLSGVVVAPRRAVLTLENQKTVFVVEDGLAKKRPVTLGPEINGNTVITSGLKVGDTLVVLGQDYLDEGYEVNITELDEGTR